MPRRRQIIDPPVTALRRAREAQAAMMAGGELDELVDVAASEQTRPAERSRRARAQVRDAGGKFARRT